MYIVGVGFIVGMDGVLFGGGVVIFKFLCLIGWEKGRGICKGDGVGIV